MMSTLEYNSTLPHPIPPPPKWLEIYQYQLIKAMLMGKSTVSNITYLAT